MLFTLILKDFRIMYRSIVYSIFEIAVSMLLFTFIGFIAFKFIQIVPIDSDRPQSNDFVHFNWEKQTCYDCGPDEYIDEPAAITIPILLAGGREREPRPGIRNHDTGLVEYVGIEDDVEGLRYTITSPLQDSAYTTSNWDKGRWRHAMDEQMLGGMLHFLTKKTGSDLFKYTGPIFYDLPKTDPAAMSGYVLRIMQNFIILVVINITRNIVHEKATFRQYLVSMGLPISTYYLSHFLFNFAKCLFIFVPGFFFFAQTQKSTSIAIYLCISTLFYLIPAITFAFLIASLFKTGKAAILTCLVVWVALISLPYFLIGDNSEKLSNYWIVLPTSLIFTFNMHYIGETLDTMAEFNEYSFWAVSDRVYPLCGLWLALLVNAAMMFGLAVLVDDMGGRLNLIGCWHRIFHRKKEKEHDDSERSYTITQDTGTSPNSSTKRSSGGADSQTHRSNDETTPLLDGAAQDQSTRNKLESDIDIHDVVKIYPTGEMAVKGLTMRAIRGQVSVLLGHNGCGKSSTFAMIAGMSKPTEGRIEVCGLDVVSNLYEARMKIGLCPQYNPIIDKLTVWEHLKIVHSLKNAETPFEEDAQNLLEAIGLYRKRDELSMNLSGGMKRKLCMCMALIGESRVVLLDEPTAGMDVGARQDVQKMLRSIKKDRTILLTTHNMDEADKLADWVYVMSEGRIQASGSSQFLKSKFGGGWLITVVVDDAEKDAPILLDVCRTFEQGATIKDTRGQMIEFNVPSDDKNQVIQMVKCLEAISEKDFNVDVVKSLPNLEQVKNVQISSVGVSLNSLEQVFINVIEKCEKETDKTRTVEQKAENLHKLLEKKEEDPAFGPLSQFLGLSLKRFLYLRRNMILHFMNIMIPISLLLLIIFSTNSYKTYVGVHTTKFDMNLIPPSSIVVIQTDSEAPEIEAFFKKHPNLIIKKLRASRNLTDIVRTEQFFQRISVVVKVENQVATKVWINDKMLKAKAIGAYLRLKLPPGLMSTDYKITFNWVVSADNRAVYSSIDILIVMFSTLLLTYNISTCALLHAEERVSNFKHQQFLTEMSPFIYWFAMYFWEFVIFAFSVAGFVGIFAYFKIIWGQAVFQFFWISCLTWLATAPIVFITSFLVDSPTKITLLIILFCFFLPLIKMICDAIIILTTTPIEIDFREGGIRIPKFPWIHYTRFLCPLQPFISLVIWSYYNMDTKGLDHVKGLVRFVFEHEIGTVDVFRFDGITLAGSALLYNLVLFLITSRFLQRTINGWIHSSHLARNKTPLNMEPCEEVEKEEKDVKVGHLNPENCTVLVDELVKRYGDYQAVNGVYLGVKQGECFGLLGVNGAGKSTMIEILMGKQFACSGKATIGEVPVEKAVRVGYCPQFDAVLSEFTGRDILKILARLHNYPHASELVDELIDCVGMKGNADKQIRYCSGGQKRKISMGMGILSRSWGHSGGGLIILDEPTAGVDPKARRDLWDIVVGMRRSERNRTGIMLTSHSMEECEALCTRIGILRKGEMIALATHQHLKSKYGNTFTLTIVGIKNENGKKEILEKIRATFGEKSILLTDEDDHTNNLVWEIPREKGEKWSTKMDEVKKVAEELEVDNYFLVQSSLEDTFIKMNSPNIEKNQV